MQMSRNKLIVTTVVVLLAIVGWAMYSAIRSGYDKQEARFADERAELTARIAALSGERDQLAVQRTELEQTLEKERAAAGDLASLRERIDTAAGALNQRMATLGARERDLAAIDTSLAQAKQQLAGLEEQQATVKQRLGSRLTALGGRERDLAQAERALSKTGARQEALTGTLDQLTKSVAEKRAALGALNLELGTLERDRSHRANDLAAVEAELAATRTNLDQVRAQLDKALLAQSVAELQARQAALQQQLTSLDAELAHKKPLFARSVDLSREIATFDEQLRSLTAQRAERAKEFSDVVTRIEQPAPGQGAGARQETGSADGNRGGVQVETGSREGVARAASQ
jgi:chromosome segregation ATPase